MGADVGCVKNARSTRGCIKSSPCRRGFFVGERERRCALLAVESQDFVADTAWTGFFSSCAAGSSAVGAGLRILSIRCIGRAYFGEENLTKDMQIRFQYYRNQLPIIEYMVS